jgi:hypothetical protein
VVEAHGGCDLQERSHLGARRQRAVLKFPGDAMHGNGAAVDLQPSGAAHCVRRADPDVVFARSVDVLLEPAT